jgi:membrane protein YdbS with pleckstrin-like domain
MALRYLLPDEQQVITVRQHPAKLLPGLTAAAGGVMAATAAGLISQGVPSATVVVWLLAGFLLLRALWHVISWAVQFIVVTEKRLILNSGLTGRKVTVIPLGALQDLAFTRSPGGRLLGYGAFTFGAEGQAMAVLDYIPYPEQLYLEIYGLLYPAEAGDSRDDGPGGSGHDFDEG